MIRFVVSCTLFAELGVTTASAQCILPTYEVGRVTETTELVSVTISMALRDFARTKLLCLVPELKKRYGGRTRLEVLMFSSAEAARDYRGDFINGHVTESGREYGATKLHAIYRYAMGYENIRIKPIGFYANLPEDTRIDLPTAVAPRCHLEVDGRCLLALEELTYAGEAGKVRIPGTVTLSATIAADGSLKNIQVREANSEASARQTFVDEATHNLMTWHFEEAPNPNSLVITYAYAIDASLERGRDHVDFDLPKRITIKANR